jgi:hypothetical protein
MFTTGRISILLFSDYIMLIIFNSMIFSQCYTDKEEIKIISRHDSIEISWMVRSINYLILSTI